MIFSNMRLTCFPCNQSTILSFPLPLLYMMQFLLYQAPLPLLPCLGPTTFKLLNWAGDDSCLAAGSISQSLAQHCCNEDCFIQSCCSCPSLQEHRQFASFTHWFCCVEYFEFICWGLGENVRVGPQGVLRPLCGSIHVTGMSSFLSLVSFGILEAAERGAICSRERCVQEPILHQDHNRVHWRGESPPSSRAGPLTGNSTRGGTQNSTGVDSRTHPYCINSRHPLYNSAFHTLPNHVVPLLRLWQKRRRCWSGRGSMKTADRKWWRCSKIYYTHSCTMNFKSLG